MPWLQDNAHLIEALWVLLYRKDIRIMGKSKTMLCITSDTWRLTSFESHSLRDKLRCISLSLRLNTFSEFTHTRQLHVFLTDITSYNTCQKKIIYQFVWIYHQPRVWHDRIRVMSSNILAYFIIRNSFFLWIHSEYQRAQFNLEHLRES